MSIDSLPAHILADFPTYKRAKLSLMLFYKLAITIISRLLSVDSDRQQTHNTMAGWLAGWQAGGSNSGTTTSSQPTVVRHSSNERTTDDDGGKICAAAATAATTLGRYRAQTVIECVRGGMR